MGRGFLQVVCRSLLSGSRIVDLKEYKEAELVILHPPSSETADRMSGLTLGHVVYAPHAVLDWPIWH